MGMIKNDDVWESWHHRINALRSLNKNLHVDGFVTNPTMAQLVKNPPAMWETWVRSMGSVPGLGRSPGEGNGYPLQYSGLENSMACIVHRVSKSQTGLSDFHF